DFALGDGCGTETELRYLLGWQEAALMAMADGYAQASGKLAVVNLHVTPGLGNAMGMLYDAQKAGAPILVTAGQHEQSFNATEPILWADLPTIARPLVKWSSEVHRLADLPRLVHPAAKTALAPRTAPVFLSLPGEILRADGGAGPARGPRGGRGRGGAARGRGASRDHGRRRGGAKPRPRRAGRARRARGGTGLCRVRAEYGVVSVLASAVSRRHGPARARRAQDARSARRPVLGGQRSVHAVAAVGRRSNAAEHQAHPSRCRSLGAWQELSAGGRHSRRPEGDAAGDHRRGARAHVERRARRGADAARPRPAPHR